MVRERRALSTIVGALLFLVILVSAFGSMLTAMSFMTSFQEKSMEVSSQTSDQLSEKFGTRIRMDTDCELFVEVVNNSPTAIEVTEFFLINTTDNDIERYDVSNAIIAPEARVNVTHSSFLSLDGVEVSQNITLAKNKEYVAKVVTNLGTLKEKAFATGSSCGNSPLVGKLIAIPPEFASGDKLTVAFVVVNAAEVDMRNVSLTSSSLSVNPAGALDSQTLITSSSEPNLTAGGTTIFMWEIFLKGAIGQNMTISTSATNSFGDTTGTQEVEVKITREYTRQAVSQKLVAKPEVFLIVPGPFGENGEKAVWGAVIANPTDVIFTVSRVTFVLATVGSESSQNIVNTACQDDGLEPNSGDDTRWSCPNENLIEWRDTITPVTVPARSVQPFIVKALPGSSGTGNNDISAFLASVSVHTSFGQISRGDYASAMEGASPGAIGQVFMTTTNDDATATNDANVIGNLTFDVNPVTMQKVNVTIADKDVSSSTYLNSGSKLIINVPAGFTVGQLTNSTKFSTVTMTTFDDESSQIVATLGQNLGDQASAEAAVMMLEITPPAVLEDRIYIMYTLADGVSSSGLTIGATAEVPFVADY
jgi:hypothetical protein